MLQRLCLPPQHCFESQGKQVCIHGDRFYEGAMANLCKPFYSPSLSTDVLYLALGLTFFIALFLLALIIRKSVIKNQN